MLRNSKLGSGDARQIAPKPAFLGLVADAYASEARTIYRSFQRRYGSRTRDIQIPNLVL
jgi:hypothetical protein